MPSRMVELPPECMITDKRTWERQQRRLAVAEGQARSRAERLQLLETANEALRHRVAEAEEAALEAMAEAETVLNRRSVKELQVGRVKRALMLALTALERVWAGAPSKGVYGGTIDKALPAVKRALKDL